MKHKACNHKGILANVAPRAGAWIETFYYGHTLKNSSSRPPRGGVD